MKRTLLAVPSLALAWLIAGCTTQLVDSRGNPVYDSAGQPVMVSSSTSEKMEKSAPAVREVVRHEIERVSKSSTTVVTTESVKISNEKLIMILGAEAREEDIVALKAMAAAEARKYLLEVEYPARVTVMKKAMEAKVTSLLAANKLAEASEYIASIRANKTGIAEIDKPVLAFADELSKGKIAPALAEQVIAKLRKYVPQFVADGKHEKAREILWRACAAGSNEDVKALVRLYAVEQMRVVVNPSEWAIIEADIKSRAAALAKENKFDEAIAWLKGYRRVRTYSVKLDEKLKTVEAELVKIGVNETNMPPILAATQKLVAEAAKIVDMTDVTTNAVTTIAGAEHAATTLDLKAYQERLEEYRKLLVRYDCTESAAEGIAKKFDADVDPLLKPLAKPASKDADRTESKAFLQLGTGALNARIDKLTAATIADLEKQKKAWLVATRKAQIKAAIDDLTAKVKKLVADGAFAEAREAIWEATSTEDIELNGHVREVGTKLMLKLVNPTHWTAIEKEFADKTKEATDGAAYDEAIAWAEAYPDIRTYTAAIDARLDGVKAELAKLGIAEDKVQPVVDETQKATVRAERLFSDVDTVEKTTGAGDKKLPLEEYEKLLADYRTALVRNDCTEANADRLVADFKKKITPCLNALAGGKEKSEVVLGSNAVNKRLAALRAKTVETLKSKKYKFVFTDLIAKVSQAVADGNYAEARNVIRDVPLVQDKDWDARIYATRIGLLNSVVNPNQYVALQKEIDAKVKELFDAKDYEAFREYAKSFPYVHDTYKQIIDALEQVKVAMVGLTIADEDAGKYIDKLSARVREMLEKRPGTYTVETDKDLTELEKALAELEKGIVKQYYKPETVKEFCQIVKKEILNMISGAAAPMTTWELNEALRIHLESYLGKLDDLIAKRDAANEADAYAKLLAEIDAEFSFDSQIAMAEDAIAKQLGVKCPAADLKMRALLGEYARTMRLMKLGKKIDVGQATVMLLGGVYLDQSAVVARALELGAKVNGVSDRDPLARTGILVAIQTGHNAFLKQLADAGASLDPVDAVGDTALHYAVTRGNLSVVNAMLKKNDVDKVNKAGESALFIAVRKNQAAVAAALVKAKADVSIKNAKGQTAMDAACLAGSRDVLDVLADAGAEYGPAQLAYAARTDHLAVAQWLVGKGVDVNALGVMGATICMSDTQCYLVHEGGIKVPCTDPDCRCRAKADGRCKAENAAKAK